MEEVVGSIPTRSTNNYHNRITHLRKDKRICANFV
jgi:hypothetical protein